jgi:hypothetical protein
MISRTYIKCAKFSKQNREVSMRLSWSLFAGLLERVFSDHSQICKRKLGSDRETTCLSLMMYRA